jgi:hypothetical protein
VCGVGNYQIDLSYTGDFLKQKLQRIYKGMTVLTMYDNVSSKIDSKYTLKNKPRKNPDMTLNKDNFDKNENQKNFFVLFNTAEPLIREEVPTAYFNSFTSAK